MPETKDLVMQAMRDLPQLPLAVQKLLAVMRDENSSADDVTQVLQSDQALAGKILKLVNSSYYGMSGEVSTITRAVVVLGFSGVRNVAMGFGMVSALKKLGGVSVATFWDHSLSAGAGAQAMAPLLGSGHDPEEAFIAGLMHDIGHVVLASAVPDAWGEAQERVQRGGDPIETEKELVGMSHASVGQRLMKYWQLPVQLQEAARWHHNVKVAAGREQPLTTLAALGDVLACIHGGAFESPPPEEDLGRLLRLNCLEVDQIRTALAGMDARIEEMRVFLKIADDSDDLHVTGGPDLAEPGGAVFLSSDQDRMQWVGGLLQEFGCHLFPLRDYFEQEPGHDQVRLVVLDPNSLTAPQIKKIVPFLDQQPAVTCVLHDSQPGPLATELAARYPVLPYVFSRQDLIRTMSGETVAS
ncbi:HDOD domain-containing protein [bacterium]|nr:HDOD domain-containing protein [bacterium]